MIESPYTKNLPPFNGPVETGLRALSLLSEAFPEQYSLQRLVVLDYLLIHSDDLPGGPPGLHPRTPHRGGELLVRRAMLEQGLMLYQSRGLLERHYTETGLMFAATDRAAGFLDVLSSDYVAELRERAIWLVPLFGDTSDSDLLKIVNSQSGEWGAEFAMESVLRVEDAEWQ
ncbi:ABC-three component system middle component 2 [Massilia sp. HP4]|uniref:ABC-three component system middle component 2 n=1 Tax=Massilia sp. HP4 TaxID=2562316 RepID=UPI0010BF7F4B|nr:ABC-three component system middle component 2 [Massilia sp. HP4]